MCCAFLILVFLGPRVFGALWWLIQPLRWQAAFSDLIGSGGLWWLWPVLGLVFVPWMTIMFVILAPGGIVSWDWLWMGLALLADIAWYAGGAGRRQIPQYQGY